MGCQPGLEPRVKFMKHLQALSFSEVQPHTQALSHHFMPFIPFRVAGRQLFSGAQAWMLFKEALHFRLNAYPTASRRDGVQMPSGLRTREFVPQPALSSLLPVSSKSFIAAPETSPGTLPPHTPPPISFPSALHSNPS